MSDRIESVVATALSDFADAPAVYTGHFAQARAILHALKTERITVVELHGADRIAGNGLSYFTGVGCDDGDCDCCPGGVRDDNTEIDYALDEAEEYATAMLSAVDLARAAEAEL